MEDVFQGSFGDVQLVVIVKVVLDRLHRLVAGIFGDRRFIRTSESHNLVNCVSIRDAEYSPDLFPLYSAEPAGSEALAPGG